MGFYFKFEQPDAYNFMWSHDANDHNNSISLVRDGRWFHWIAYVDCERFASGNHINLDGAKRAAKQAFIKRAEYGNK